MRKISLDLSYYRLHLHLVKRRKTSYGEALMPDLNQLRRTRSGNKISRFFRHVFEHKSIKRILGANLTLMVVASSFIPTPINAEFVKTEEIIISAAPTQPFTTQVGTRYPVDKVKINQGYRAFHPGLDFEGVTGDAVYPIMSGSVAGISTSRYAYGNAVVVNHGGKITSLYAHLSKISVSAGQIVTTSTKLGEVGSTGRSSGDHLHLEVRDHERPINPYIILPR